jgi:hypothetical protein
VFENPENDKDTAMSVSAATVYTCATTAKNAKVVWKSEDDIVAINSIKFETVFEILPNVRA